MTKDIGKKLLKYTNLEIHGFYSGRTPLIEVRLVVEVVAFGHSAVL